jgi:hypothetical protein
LLCLFLTNLGNTFLPLKKICDPRRRCQFYGEHKKGDLGGVGTATSPTRGAAMTKIVKIKVLVLLVAILTVTLAVSPVQACACGEDWSKMSDEEIVSNINGAEEEPRIVSGQSGALPPAPAGYQYDANYKLIPLQ